MQKKYQNGPDQIKPAEHFWSFDPEKAVKLKISGEGIASRKPISVPSLLNKTAAEYPETPALCYKNEKNEWETLTYSQYKEKVHHIAKTFIKIGLEPRHSISILSRNCPEWVISDLAAIHAGGISTGIYPTSYPEVILDALNDSRTNIIIVDDDVQLQKVLKIRDKARYLKSIVQILPSEIALTKEIDGYYKWKSLEEDNELMQYQIELESRLKNICINECCSLVFTSGTTGNSKGVMFSHDNLTWNGYATSRCMSNICPGNESTVSYLPLCHTAAHMFDFYIPLTNAMTVYFAEKDALKGKLFETMRFAKPTRLVGVPRVFEKMYEYLEGKVLEPEVAKQMVGFSNIQSVVCGGAPMSLQVKRYFLKMQLPFMEGYGLTETSCAHTLSTLKKFNERSAGAPLDGCEIKLKDIDVKGQGEFMVRGRNVCMGYIYMETPTKEAIEDDGWLHTGDIGYIDENGLIYVTDRLKELIITSGGSNIAPAPIEHCIKAELPIISHVCLVGDKQKYLSALVTLKTEIDNETGVPMDDLTLEVIEWVRKLGLNYTKLSEILSAGPISKVTTEILNAIDRVNYKAGAHTKTIKKFAILQQDFSIATGELSPTMKLKRKVVLEKYKNIINKIYNSS